MQNITHSSTKHTMPLISPWSLRAWPPILWQAGLSSGLRFHHLSTRVSISDEQNCRVAGQTLWGGVSSDGEAGVAWDWIEMPRGLVAMADPMCVVTNIRLVGDEGEVLTAFEAARFLNEIVHMLPWQSEVQRAIRTPH